MNQRTPCECPFCWRGKRTPALGWNTMTLLEALADSAKAGLAVNSFELVNDRLSRMLQILREEISLAKKRSADLLNRCEFRETKRTRCNRYPAFLTREGFLCKDHVNIINKHDNKQSDLLEVLEMCLTKQVYCWHCLLPFEKKAYVEGSVEDFEDCPHCGKGWEDLSTEAQRAVHATLKPFEGKQLAS